MTGKRIYKVEIPEELKEEIKRMRGSDLKGEVVIEENGSGQLTIECGDKDDAVSVKICLG